MPHVRSRKALHALRKLAKLWPVVGVVGLRQVGKSTLLRDLLKIDAFASMDDEDVRQDAESSAKVFLAKYPRPLVIDEIQKVPRLFDAIKSEVDRRRIPGTFFVTGSQSFVGRDLTRESLTGRIGSVRLLPLTLREGLGGQANPRLEDFVRGMSRGGLPVPMFLRDEESRRLYWDGWLETTLLRDLARAHGKGYDLDFARLVLKEIGDQLAGGAFVEITRFSRDSRKVGRYLQSMEDIFLLHRVPCHEKGVGRDHWLLGDAGLAAHLMKGRLHTEHATLSLARHAIFNEIFASREYALRNPRIRYFKSARGEPVDFVIDDGVPVKVITRSGGKLGWFEKGLKGAMKKLGSRQGFLCAPIERSDPVKKTGITRVSWLHFS